MCNERRGIASRAIHAHAHVHIIICDLTISHVRFALTGLSKSPTKYAKSERRGPNANRWPESYRTSTLLEDGTASYKRSRTGASQLLPKQEPRMRRALAIWSGQGACEPSTELGTGVSRCTRRTLASRSPGESPDSAHTTQLTRGVSHRTSRHRHATEPRILRHDAHHTSQDTALSAVCLTGHCL